MLRPLAAPTGPLVAFDRALAAPTGPLVAFDRALAAFDSPRPLVAGIRPLAAPTAPLAAFDSPRGIAATAPLKPGVCVLWFDLVCS